MDLLQQAAPSNSQTIAVTIGRSRDEVYRFVADPSNLARWAAGLGAGFERRGELWIADTPQGKVQVKFAPQNAFGVVDHWVTLASGEAVYVPLRVLENGSASEVILTVFQRAGMSDADFASDAAAVRRDLAELKRVMEAR